MDSDNKFKDCDGRTFELYERELKCWEKNGSLGFSCSVDMIKAWRSGTRAGTSTIDLGVAGPDGTFDPNGNAWLFYEFPGEDTAQKLCDAIQVAKDSKASS